MYSKKVKLRFVFIIVFLTLVALTTFTVLKVLKDNTEFYEIKNGPYKKKNKDIEYFKQ